MRLDAGDIVLAPFPYSDLAASKVRPALVLSNGAYNGSGEDVIVCAVTSNLANAAHAVLIEPRDMATGRLKVASRAKVDRVASLKKALMRRRLGRVRPAVMEQVRKELARLFDLPR